MAITHATRHLHNIHTRNTYSMTRTRVDSDVTCRACIAQIRDEWCPVRPEAAEREQASIAAEREQLYREIAAARARIAEIDAELPDHVRIIRDEDGRIARVET